MAEVGGAVLGAIFGEILRTVLKKKSNVIMFKSTLANFQSIIQTLDPLIKQIVQLNNNLGRPKEELESLISEMDKGSILISKCSQIHKMNYFAKVRYQKKIKAQLDSLCVLFNVEMLAQLVRDQKKTLLTIERILDESSFKRVEVTGSDYSTEMQLNNEIVMGTNSVEEAISQVKESCECEPIRDPSTKGTEAEKSRI